MLVGENIGELTDCPSITEVFPFKFVHTSRCNRILQGLKKLFFTTSHDLFLSNHYMDYDHHNITGILAFLMMAASRHEWWPEVLDN